jgi:hypothetical protein
MIMIVLCKFFSRKFSEAAINKKCENNLLAINQSLGIRLWQILHPIVSEQCCQRLVKFFLARSTYCTHTVWEKIFDRQNDSQNICRKLTADFSGRDKFQQPQ